MSEEKTEMKPAIIVVYSWCHVGKSSIDSLVEFLKASCGVPVCALCVGAAGGPRLEIYALGQVVPLPSFGVDEFRELLAEKIKEQARTEKPDDPLRCHANGDDFCLWSHCPQIRDEEPIRSGRHCPLDKRDEEQ